jgi:hypothetical protein
MATTSALKVLPTVANGAVSELVTEARIEALNHALAEYGIDASRIITILEMPAQLIANSVPARFRVLYRTR